MFLKYFSNFTFKVVDEDVVYLYTYMNTITVTSAHFTILIEFYLSPTEARK